MGVFDKWRKPVTPRDRKSDTPPVIKQRKTIAEAALQSAGKHTKDVEPDQLPDITTVRDIFSLSHEISEYDPALQKKLNTYFKKLETVYPDHVIIRLNTGQKKLAERGSQLRHMIHWNGSLDDFFALGGFSYQRSESGRPQKLKTEQDISELIGLLKSRFPNGVSAAAEIDKTDHTLFLSLRAAARKSGCNLTTFLNNYNLYQSKGSN